MKRLSFALAVCVLSGCALTVDSSNPRQVVIEKTFGLQSNKDAQTLADAECAKYKRYAKMEAFPVPGVSRTWMFSCVE